ncbi:MAG: hypothetical protein KAI33_04215 [Elusimicrobiales bacterium]|nr:hypothetical protein [Elusimicrobiales bacterium]
MALIIKSLFGMFWAFSSSFLVYLIYVVMQTESDPRIRWAWIIMTGFTFMAATLLAYIVINAQTVSSAAANAATEETNPSQTESNTD